MESLVEGTLIIPCHHMYMRGEGLRKSTRKPLIGKKNRDFVQISVQFLQLTPLDQLTDREYKVFGFAVVTEADVFY